MKIHQLHHCLFIVQLLIKKKKKNYNGQHHLTTLTVWVDTSECMPHDYSKEPMWFADISSAKMAVGRKRAETKPNPKCLSTLYKVCGLNYGLQVLDVSVNCNQTNVCLSKLLKNFITSVNAQSAIATWLYKAQKRKFYTYNDIYIYDLVPKVLMQGVMHFSWK